MFKLHAMIESLLNIFKFKNNEASFLLKRTLNILFVSGIASFIFKAVYFEYELIDFLNYKGYYIFFINGDFIVPLSLFGISWYGTLFISYVLFRIPSYLVGIRIQRGLLKLSFKNISKEKAQDIDDRVKKVSGLGGKDFYFKFFEGIKKSISSEDLSKIQSRAIYLQRKLEFNFTVLIRGICATIFYFINVPHFGWVLLVVLLIASGMITILMYVQYFLFEAIPILVFKGLEGIDHYLKEIEEANKKNPSNLDNTV